MQSLEKSKFIVKTISFPEFVSSQLHDDTKTILHDISCYQYFVFNLKFTAVTAKPP
jgi:hypothetical protein